MTTFANNNKNTVAALDAEIADLKGALDNLGETEPCSWAARQESAILDRLAAAEEELEALEGAYYNDQAEGLGY